MELLFKHIRELKAEIKSLEDGLSMETEMEKKSRLLHERMAGLCLKLGRQFPDYQEIQHVRDLERIEKRKALLAQLKSFRSMKEYMDWLKEGKTK